MCVFILPLILSRSAPAMTQRDYVTLLDVTWYAMSWLCWQLSGDNGS